MNNKHLLRIILKLFQNILKNIEKYILKIQYNYYTTVNGNMFHRYRGPLGLHNAV